MALWGVAGTPWHWPAPGACRTYRSPGGTAFAPGTWLVATAAEDLGDGAGGPYGRYLAVEVREGRLEGLPCERFVQRRAMSGEPIEYTAVRARRA